MHAGTAYLAEVLMFMERDSPDGRPYLPIPFKQSTPELTPPTIRSQSAAVEQYLPETMLVGVRYVPEVQDRPLPSSLLFLFLPIHLLTRPPIRPSGRR